MQNYNKTQRSLADLRLGPIATAQLDEIARHHEQSFDQAAIMAVHTAYLALLDQKREDALQALNMSSARPHPDDELPF